jgi:hypothetical protein
VIGGAACTYTRVRCGIKMTVCDDTPNDRRVVDRDGATDDGGDGGRRRHRARARRAREGRVR